MASRCPVLAILSEDGLYTAWVALSDISSTSGPVQFIAGSNKWNAVNGFDFFDKNIDSRNRLLASHDESAVPLIAKRGDVVFFHFCTLHGSMINKSSKPKKNYPGSTILWK